MWRSGLGILVILAGCAAGNHQQAGAQQPASNASLIKTCPKAAASFAEWTGQFRQYAISQGAPGRLVDQAFSQVSENPKVRAAAEAQPEFVTPVWTYLDRVLTKERIARGRQLRDQYKNLLQGIAKDYGVPPEVILAIWGIESDFGRFTGDVNVFEALSNVGYATERADFACRELLAALKIAQTGVVLPQRMIGSWAGAMGHTQFLPSKYLTSAVDRDKSGTADIWNSFPDIFASTANHLRQDHWQAHVPWGVEVTLPRNFSYAEAELDTLHPVAYWQKKGVRAIKGKTLPLHEQDTAILLLAGRKGPAFLVTKNFKALLSYNYSTSYALAVAYLAEAIANRPLIQADWPRNEQPLALQERLELQNLLQREGFFSGKSDGVIGLGTRKAIRAFQQHWGLIPDGYATQELLGELRRRIDS